MIGALLLRPKYKRVSDKIRRRRESGENALKRKRFLVEHVGTILGQAELGASVADLIGTGEGIRPSPRNQTTPRGEHQAETGGRVSNLGQNPVTGCLRK